MAAILDHLLSQPQVAIVIPLVLVLLMCLFPMLLLVAFFQGRSISFWPPRIGQRPTKSPDERKTASLTQVEQRADPGPSTVRHKEWSGGKQKESALLSASADEDSRAVDFQDSRELLVKQLICSTRHGRIEEVAFRGIRYVLKRTDTDELVDFAALQAIAGQRMGGFFEGTSVRIATPTKVWKEGRSVCELHPYYSGLRLYDIVERNRYTLRGTYLGIIYDCGLRALSRLHMLGLLHRDVTPDNMLMTPKGDILIMDVSFCCRKEYQGRPVFNRAFSPLEQRDGKAVEQSDWYSFTSSIYFLANGISPLATDPNAVRAGIWNIDLGPFYHRNPEREELMEALLAQDVNKRPSSYRDILLRTGTYERRVDVYGVLDLAGLGFMVLYPDGFTIGTREDVRRELREKLPTSNVADGLRRDMEAFEEGGNPWLKE